MRRVALVLLALSTPVAAQDLASTLPVIVTTGEATLQRPPDRAVIDVAVDTRDKSPRETQRLNAGAMTAVQQRLADLRIPKDAMRTLGYAIHEEFDVVQGKRISRGFAARNTLEVRLDDVARVGEILDALVQAGATTVDNVRFDLRERAAVEREALRLAVADARARADAAAEGAGRTIDRVIRIEDARQNVDVSPRVMFAAAAEKTADTPVAPGLIDIRAQVTFTASFK